MTKSHQLYGSIHTAGKNPRFGGHPRVLSAFVRQLSMNTTITQIEKPTSGLCWVFLMPGLFFFVFLNASWNSIGLCSVNARSQNTGIFWFMPLRLFSLPCFRRVATSRGGSEHQKKKGNTGKKKWHLTTFLPPPPPPPPPPLLSMKIWGKIRKIRGKSGKSGKSG